MKYDIVKDYSRDSLFDEMGIRRLRDSYLREDEESPQDRLAFVSAQFASNQEHAQRLYDYSSKHWLSFSTPILAFGKSSKGLPVSCYLSSLADSAESLVDTLAEVSWLSMIGGGVSIGFGIRSEDEKSVGVLPHLKVYESASMAYRQGKTRRGSFAAYLDIDHPNIVQFIDMRKPTGDTNLRCLELHHGINVSDKFMEIIEKSMLDSNFDDSWELKDPDSNVVKEVVSARWLWEKILETRMRTGEPYLFFIDTVNRAMPKFQKDLGLSIKQSNLCVTGDTLVQIIDVDNSVKTIRIDEAISLMKSGKNIKFKSKNLETGEEEYKQVIDGAMTARNSQLLLIEDVDTGKSIRCTEDHKIYTKNRGYVMAKDLKEDDVLDIS